MSELQGDIEFLTVTEVSALLRVTRQTVFSWEREGLIPAGIRIGRTKRWLREDFARWLAAKQAGCVRVS